MIEKNSISTFEDIVLLYGPTNTATLFGSNTDTVKSRIRMPEKFRVEAFHRLSDLVEVPHSAIFTLVDNQYIQNKSKKKK